MIEKNGVYETEIRGISSDGNGVGRIGEMAVFVPYSAVGDVVKVRISKLKKRYAEGRIEEIIEPSKDRVKPECGMYEKCGGCKLLHMSYAAQLRAKREIIESAMQRIGGFEGFELDGIIGMDEPRAYRNKAVYHAQGSGKETVFGFYAAKSHEVFSAEECLICAKENKAIIGAVKEFMGKYNLSAPENVKQLFVRKSKHTGEVMAVISEGERGIKNAAELADILKEACADIASVIIEGTDGKKRVVYGKSVIEDSINGIKFEISADSFFQVNPEMVGKLYGKALEYACLTGAENVMDVYCGIGTISLCAAQKAKRVVGIEIVERAIEDAKRNAELNGFGNTEFYAGKAEKLVPRLIGDGFVPDTVILDPPRAGSDADTLEAIVGAGPERVVYVSCDPATLARDLRYLCDRGYALDRAVGVDMFCGTTHVETVCSLVLRRSHIHINIDVDVEELLQDKRGQATY